MSIKKTEAIVLRSIKQGETRKILFLYSRAFGKIKVIAKGARSAKSRYGGTLEPLNYISVVYYEKETRDLQFLSSADLIQSFERVLGDVNKIALAMAVCELINKLEMAGESNFLMFKHLLAALQGIDQSEQPLHVFRGFQVRLFDLLGFKPNFDNCLNCGQQRNSRCYFSLNRGGFICDNCIDQTATGMIMSAQCVMMLRKLQSTALTHLGTLAESDSVWHEVDTFLYRFLRYHTEGLGELNSLRFLQKLGMQ